MPTTFRVCVVDSFSSEARRPGALPTQGAQLADLLESEGGTVLRTSYCSHPVVRAADMAGFLIRRRDEYDAVLLQMFGHRAFNYARVVSRIARLLDKRFVVVLRDGDLPNVWRDRRAAMEAVLDRADVIVTPSRWLQELVAPRYAAVVIPNVIDVPRYPFALREHLAPRLIWARAYHAQYDPLLAIEVLDELRRTHEDAMLTMAGPDQGLRAACEAAVATRSLRDRVNLHGMLPKDELIRRSAEHDIHLHTNAVDNMPVTFLEQMALGLPIVAAAVDGIPFLVDDGENGLLVRSRDPAAYADAIRSLLGDPRLAARLSRNGREFVEGRCSWNATRERWLASLGATA